MINCINKEPLSKVARGTLIPITRLEYDFWRRFPELSSDDPEEDEHNEIIGILRNTAVQYFKRLVKEKDN